MNNLKGIAVVTDGNTKRVAMTYDVINSEGVVTDYNKKINRICTDSNVLEAITVLESYAQTIIDSQEE